MELEMGLLGKHLLASRAPVANHRRFAALGSGFLADSRRLLWPSRTSLQPKGREGGSLLPCLLKH